jgi:hypothetical protein
LMLIIDTAGIVSSWRLASWCIHELSPACNTYKYYYFYMLDEMLAETSNISLHTIKAG